MFFTIPLMLLLMIGVLISVFVILWLDRQMRKIYEEPLAAAHADTGRFHRDGEQAWEKKYLGKDNK